MMPGEDTPLHVVPHGLQIANPGLPPLATSVSGHPVALLHEEGQGPTTLNGAEDLIKQGGRVVPSCATPCLPMVPVIVQLIFVSGRGLVSGDRILAQAAL